MKSLNAPPLTQQLYFEEHVLERVSAGRRVSEDPSGSMAAQHREHPRVPVMGGAVR